MPRSGTGPRLGNADPAQPDGELTRHRIAKLSRLLSGLCLAVVLAVALNLGQVTWSTAASLDRLASEIAMTDGRYAVFVAGWFASQAILIWGLWSARGCFTGLARGDLFAAPTIRGLRNFAVSLFAYKAIALIMFVAAESPGRLLAMERPLNRVTLHDFGEGAITLILLGAIVAITAVLAHAAEIADDHSQVV